MPWTSEDAARHSSGLSAHQRMIWARVATRARSACLAEGRGVDACDAAAIRQANTVSRRAPTKAITLTEAGDLDILAVPFGGPLEGGKDLDGEFFSARTELCLPWFPSTRPLLYEHGLDDDLTVEPVGTVDVTTASKDAAGWWVRAQLDKGARYWRHIRDLLDQEALYASSGAMPHLIKRAKDGEILRWPWVELSLTPNPSNLFAIVQPAAAKSHYLAAGLTPPPTIDADETHSFTDRIARITDEAADLAILIPRLTRGREEVKREARTDTRRRLYRLMARELRELLREAQAAAGELDVPDEVLEAELADEPAPATASADHAPPVEEAPGPPPVPSPLLALFEEFTRLDRLYGPQAPWREPHHANLA